MAHGWKSVKNRTKNNIFYLSNSQFVVNELRIGKADNVIDDQNFNISKERKLAYCDFYS